MVPITEPDIFRYSSYHANISLVVPFHILYSSRKSYINTILDFEFIPLAHLHTLILSILDDRTCVCTVSEQK
jgi:hypothetical protein